VDGRNYLLEGLVIEIIFKPSWNALREDLFAKLLSREDG
jgi:hypothetical protein